MESAGEGAADAARKVLNTPGLGHPQLEAAVGVLGFAAAPFAAAYGAVHARQQRLSPEQMSAAEQNLAQAMRTNADSAILREKVGEIARQKTHRRLVCADSASAVPGDQPVSAVLEVAVEQLRLKASGSQYALSIVARARLIRTTDGSVLLDRSYQYESGSALFIDWAQKGGLEAVAQTAYSSLAEQIADNIFRPISAPPILLGPGEKHSHAPPPSPSSPAFSPTLSAPHPRARFENRIRCGSRPEEALIDVKTLGNQCRLTSPATISKHALRYCRRELPQTGERRVKEPGSTENPAFQPVSLGQGATVSIEIHTSRTNLPFFLRKPGTGPVEPSESSGTKSDTEQAMDGLVNDRNSVVQVLSCLAAVPLGIWEQTAGALRKGPREQTDKLATVLNEVANRKHFEQDLADELARCLRSEGRDPITSPEERIGFSVPTTRESGGAEPEKPSTLVKATTALELQVLNTELVGKRRNSRSRAVLVEMRVTITRTSDGQEIFTCPIRYRSLSRPLKEWAASDARLFRQELDACSRETARALANELIAHELVLSQPRSGPSATDRL
jgi:hypothetical protein